MCGRIGRSTWSRPPTGDDSCGGQRRLRMERQDIYVTVREIETVTTHQFLGIYGHFYQPPRANPFTSRIPREPDAAPYDNYNEKITDECYRPNAEAGNLAHISFDLGPTL